MIWALIITANAMGSPKLVDLFQTEADCMRARQAVMVFEKSKTGEMPVTECFVMVKNPGIPG